MRLSNLIITFFLFIGTIVSAQELRRPYRIFKTQEVNYNIRKNNREIINEQNKIESNVRDFERRRFSKEDFRSKDYVGIIFHIVYYPGSTHPNEEQVLSQIEALNRDFGNNRIQINHPADTLEGFVKNADVINLLFCLPKNLPRNEPPIRFIASDVKEWKADDAIKFSDKGGADPINPKKYLNIWVAKLVDGVSGYAQMPGGPDITDGIVIDYRFFGTFGTTIPPYNEGKTLTHLIGSYMGLYELWNEYAPCSDDYVKDTPIHNAPNFSQYPYRHVSTCENRPAEMVMNFMDNTDDSGMYMFTMGQKIRGVGMLAGPRKGILTQQTQCSQSLSTLNLVSESNITNNDIKSVINIKAFPNPAQRQLVLEAHLNEAGSGNVLVYNSIGTVVYSTSIDPFATAQSFFIQTEGWASGSYFVKLVAGNQQGYCHLVIVKN